MKKFKEMSKKKRIMIIVCSVLAGLVLALVLFWAFKPEPGAAVLLSEVKRGDVEQTIKTTATVTSENKSTYMLPKGVRVESVLVQPGDRIKAGDKLATFDPASLSAQLQERQQAYRKAQDTYNQAVSSNQSAKSQLSEVNTQIVSLQKQIDQLNAQLGDASNQIKDQITAEGTTASITKPDVTTPEVKPPTTAQLAEIRKRLIAAGVSEEQADALIKVIKNLPYDQVEKIIDRITSEAGSSINDVVDAINQALGEIKLPDINISESQITTLLDSALRSVKLNVELIELQTQKALLEAQTGISLIDVLKVVADAAKISYEETQRMIASISGGWYAESDGLVTQVNIKAGELFGGAPASTSSIDLSKIMGILETGLDMNSILNMVTQMNDSMSTGLVVDDTNQFAANFMAGKYDVLKLQVGQQVTITSAGGKFSGSVSSIAPTASSGSSGSGGFSLSSITSSLTGGSSAGVETKVHIDNPDNSIILGMDVDLDIQVGVQTNVIVIPMETLQIEGDGKYVYVYNEKEKMVVKKPVVIGASSDTLYEVKTGLEVGDKVVKNPTSTLKDGDKVSPKASEADMPTTET